MAITDYIDPLIFLVSLCIGLAYTYYITPQPQMIIKYPTPFNAGKIKYTDKTGTCYKYKIRSSSCPLNTDLIKTFNPQ